MQTYRLLIFLAVWKRPEITEICFMGIERLKKYGLFPIEAFAIISEESMIPLCEKYNIKYCMYKNEPLGEKKNYGISQALKLEWDYLIEIGSDDLLYNKYLDEIKPHLGKPWFGINHVVYINSEDGACRRFGTKRPFGMGRAISRKTVEALHPMWNNLINKGLDNDASFFMATRGVLGFQIRTDYPLGVDIKSKTNIWAFNYLVGVPHEINEVFEKLSEQEINAIECLITKNKSADLIGRS